MFPNSSYALLALLQAEYLKKIVYFHSRITGGGLLKYKLLIPRTRVLVKSIYGTNYINSVFVVDAQDYSSRSHQL